MKLVCKFGWRKQPVDHRDYKFSAPLAVTAALPARADVSPSLGEVLYQGRIGSCTAHAVATAIEFCQIRERVDHAVPSRLWLYYQARKIEGTIQYDAGAYLRDVVKQANIVGCPKEAGWGYDDTPADELTGLFPPGAKAAQAPSCWAVRRARESDVMAYLAIDQTLDQLRACIAGGFPFVFGFEVPESFMSDETARTGVMQMPKPGEGMVGGHAVLAYAYDDATQRLTVRNSWGTGWGQNGSFTMPYAFLADPRSCSDFWSIRQA